MFTFSAPSYRHCGRFIPQRPHRIHGYLLLHHISSRTTAGHATHLSLDMIH